MKTKELYQLFKKSDGISIDSRVIGKNQIFFALQGENFDGNRFVGNAIRKGALAAVIDDPDIAMNGCVLVEDCLKELQYLASYHREKMGSKVLAITGTNGKTTTKELMSRILSTKYSVVATKGNLNNQIGVPLTILSSAGNPDFLIIEMGASRPGDITELCAIAKPDYGIITNIGKAHMEGFGSFEGVVSTKTELYRYLKNNGGLIFFDEKNKLLTEEVIKSGVNSLPLSRINGVNLEVESLSGSEYLRLKMEYGNFSGKFDTQLFGKYNTGNIYAAISTGLYFGVEPDLIMEAIVNYKPSNNRSQFKMTPDNRLICDAYNANPESMREAIEAFAEMDALNKHIVLGDMLELGSTGIEEHKTIVGLLKERGIDSVFFIGELFTMVAGDSGYRSFRDVDEAKLYFEEYRLKGATILLKGSRGIGLERLFPIL